MCKSTCGLINFHFILLVHGDHRSKWVSCYPSPLPLTHPNAPFALVPTPCGDVATVKSSPPHLFLSSMMCKSSTVSNSPFPCSSALADLLIHTLHQPVGWHQDSLPTVLRIQRCQAIPKPLPNLSACYGCYYISFHQNLPLLFTPSHTIMPEFTKC